MRRVVLIVEDEYLVCLTLQDMLEDAGYEVVPAFNADEAITILEARRDIEYIITDIDMPGTMDGIALAAAVRDRWPPVKIIVTSGQHRPSEGTLPSGSAFLPKPYSLQSLVAAVKVLD